LLEVVILIVVPCVAETMKNGKKLIT